MTDRSPRFDFASDNTPGVHPAVLQAIVDAAPGNEAPYGFDSRTERLRDEMKVVFGPGAEIQPLFTGTAANVISLQAMCPRWGAVICASTAHIATSEGGAPEHNGGLKLLTVETTDGKLTPELIERETRGIGNVNRHQPAAVSIAQPTELGTVYTVEELRAIADTAHAHGMLLHMDGARLSNAAAALGVDLMETSGAAGVDVLSLGGTKNGLMAGEMIVSFTPDATPGIGYLAKSGMQLGSKLRFVSAQLSRLFGTDLWRENAEHANEMAALLRAGLEGLAAEKHRPGEDAAIAFARPTEANSVFVTLSDGLITALREHYVIHSLDSDQPRQVRLVTSYETSRDEVEDLLRVAREAL